MANDAIRTTTVSTEPLTPVALNVRDAAAYLAVSPGTLANWRCEGQAGGPRYAKVGTRVVYRVADLDAWLAAQVVAS